MTKANKTQIKDKILDLREKIQKQSKELHHQIEQKNKRFENLLDNSEDSTQSRTFLSMVGVLSILMTLEAIRKGHTLNQLKETLKTQNLLENKGEVVEKLYNQVNERISIIEKAENHDLKEFLKENDVYSVFEEGKLEKFLDNDKSKDNTLVKQYENKKDNTMEVSHER
jgi:hypothetical protein